MKLCGQKIVLFNCPTTALQLATTGDQLAVTVTPPPADIFKLWREASALAQSFDEAVLATPSESFDFVVLARARRWQHKTARLLAGRLQLASGRAIASESAR
jgi:hypothetical protein